MKKLGERLRKLRDIVFFLSASPVTYYISRFLLCLYLDRDENKPGEGGPESALWRGGIFCCVYNPHVLCSTMHNNSRCRACLDMR